MSISYTGGVLEAWAQIALLGVGKAGSVDVTFSILGDRRSEIQEAVWWMPEKGTSIIALGNSSGAFVHANLLYASGESQEVDIAPFATEYVRRRADKGNGAHALPGGVGESVKVTTTGPTGSLRAAGFVSSDDREFASSIRFYDPVTVAQPNLYATKFRVKNTVAPHLVLKNTTGAPLSATPRFLPLAGESSAPLELPQVTIAPHEIVELNLEPLKAAAATRADLEMVSVQVLNSGASGSLIGALCNTDATTSVTYDVPLRDSGVGRSNTGSYPWRVDDDYSTIVSITNVGDQPAMFHVNVRYAGGSYDLKPQELAAGATAIFDMKKLRDEATPDAKGSVIPRAVQSGQFHWSVYGGRGLSRLIGRSEVVSASKHISSSYSCPNCCPDSGPYGSFDPNSVTLFVDGFAPVGMNGEMRDCNGNFWSGFPVGVTYRVEDSSIIAWTPNQSGLQGVGVGESQFYADWQLTQWDSDGMDCYVSYYSATAIGDAMVGPRISFIAPDRALVGTNPGGIIVGRGFTPSTTVQVAGSGVSVTSVTFNSNGQLSRSTFMSKIRRRLAIMR